MGYRAPFKIIPIATTIVDLKIVQRHLSLYFYHKFPTMTEITDPRERAIAILMAKFIKGKLKNEEEKELDNWILDREENMKLFEKLSNAGNEEWAVKWFAERGVKPGFLKRRSKDWYQPGPSPVEFNEFYIGIVIGAVGMVVLYLIVHYL